MIGSQSGFAEEALFVDCQNFSSGVAKMAQFAQTHPKATVQEVVKAGVEKNYTLLNKFPDLKQLVTYAAEMVTSVQGKQYRPEQHEEGSFALCVQSSGNVTLMNETLKKILNVKEI